LAALAARTEGDRGKEETTLVKLRPDQTSDPARDASAQPGTAKQSQGTEETTPVTLRPSQTPDPARDARDATAQPGTAKKRSGPTGSTPEGAKPASKKKKLDFSHMVKKSLQVAVVYKDDPKSEMKEEGKAHIWRQLTQLIDAMPQSSESTGPQFERSGLVQGVFKITCTDQRSLTWLKEAVQRIQPHEGHSFQVMELSQLNRLKSVRVFVPGEISDPKVVLARLAKQNRGLDTSGWRLLNRQEKEHGQLLILGMEDASLEVLRSMGGRAHLELSRVNFVLPDQGQEETS